jgi:hypothetical protein
MGQESKIEAKVTKYAREKGCYTRKFKSPGNRGVPDRLFMTPTGVVFFIEFKAPGKQPTALQQRELDLINKSGGNAHWSSSFESGKHIVNEHLGAIK